MNRTFFVYFWKYDGSPYIKIGNSSNTGFHNRISQAKTCDIRDVQPLGIIYANDQKSAQKLETQLHNTFDRVRDDREWFYETPELTHYIIENTTDAYIVINQGLTWKRKKNRDSMQKHRSENGTGITEESRQRRRERESTPEFREKDRARRHTPEYLAKKKNYMDKYKREKEKES